MGLGKRISYGLRCFFSILLHGEIPQNIAVEMVKMPSVVAATAQTAEPRAEEKPPRVVRPSRPDACLAAT